MFFNEMPAPHLRVVAVCLSLALKVKGKRLVFVLISWFLDPSTVAKAA
jgi:hypothetical protein